MSGQTGNMATLGYLNVASGSALRVRVRSWEGPKLVIAVDTDKPIDSEVRLAFPSTSAGTVQLVGSVIGQESRSGETRAALKARALFSRDSAHLAEFITNNLGQTPGPTDIVDAAGGYFYAFDQRAKERVRTSGTQTRVPVERSGPVEKRWRRRIRLDQAVTAFGPKGPIPVILLDANEEGLRLATPTPPDLGTSVAIRMPIQSGRLKMDVEMEGTVVWASQGGAENHSWVGVHLKPVRDGAGGKHWARFIKSMAEATKDAEIPAGRRGTPLE